MRSPTIGDIVWHHSTDGAISAAMVTGYSSESPWGASLIVFWRTGGSSSIGPVRHVSEDGMPGGSRGPRWSWRGGEDNAEPAPSGIGTSPSAVAALASELQGGPLSLAAGEESASPPASSVDTHLVRHPADPIWRATGANLPCWPVGVYQGRKPVISDNFSRMARKDPVSGKQLERQHLGVDICFKADEAMKPNLPENTRWYFCPSNTIPMRAALAGTVWFAGKTPTGWTIEIDHGLIYGFPLVTYYTHMSGLNDHGWKKGDRVYPADILGYVGNSPASEDDVNHCHFEMWEYTRGNLPRQERCLDPEPYLKTWRIIGALS